ncbi:putative transcriptional regulatory protein pdtaR [Novipirellula aureliae]|uniref:Putative transcriptional regulatory protein pdtaR n=1 Tax=Novipirellula aureliae TaxID=2527966 RepID=A0A5C6E752_9BACT|nr:response regulator [Novipirellula aureliae]TWU44414.1 putative transcriptional regulatory protein pdtaR [Novipirellula aureliae]
MTHSLRIAIADDEEDIRQYFRRLLPRLGYELVVEAENGRQLVELCRSENPDLIITDVMMPEMSGIEAATEISKTLSVPIIILSSHEKPTNASKTFIVGYLQKPVSIPDLQAAITRACPAA